MEISFAEFQKIDIRIGKIIEANQIIGSKNLIKILVDFGEMKKQSVSGLLRWYKPEDLLNRICVFILNLKSRKVMGIDSQCMILAAEDSKGNVVVLQPQKEIEIGSRIR
ncbi:MAG: methionine--tRNA ligase [Candidatus Bathyarchaeota archaeon]|jgi:methionyl-tRNA synthetase|nr:methionine--tRNA ligase [Candidatus Bathyarchaeota archaeon]